MAETEFSHHDVAGFRSSVLHTPKEPSAAESPTKEIQGGGTYFSVVRLTSKVLYYRLDQETEPYIIICED